MSEDNLYSNSKLFFSSLNPAVRAMWAKSGTPDHHLISHMLDVAAVCECILEREPSSSVQIMARSLGIQSENPKRFIAACVGSHDIGKAIAGFQSKLKSAVTQEERLGLTFSNRALRHSKHGQASAKALESIWPKVISTEFSAFWVKQMASALGSHHGYPLLRTEINESLPTREDNIWIATREELMQVYWSVLAPDVTAEPAELITTPALASFCGLVSVCDWIASNQKWFPLGERIDNLASYFEDAKQLACVALDEIGWNVYKPLIEHFDAEEQLGKILNLPNKVQLRPLQKAACRLLNDAQGPVLMIVEAPMGEGKTELAFLSYLMLQRKNAHRGLYIALPTQATGRAMYDRARRFLQAYDTLNAESLQLIYSGASRQKLSAQSQNFSDVQQGLRARGNDESYEAASWFAQSKRPLIAPDGVGTIDQVLFSILNVRFHSVRVWALTNRVVVIDEVHAYDSYTGGLIESLVTWLKALHCSVILMSATLPLDRRNALLEAWGATLPPSLAYPRILLVQDRCLTYEQNISSRTQPPITVIGCHEDLQSIASIVTKALESGGCGAVIFNTVDRAQAFYELLKKSLSEDVIVIVFHSRFPASRRSGIEKRVLSVFGKGDERPKKAILIATQVAEQSLDVDFDFLVSDLAPIDLILQRVGRLHRHSRNDRPRAHLTPVLTVAGLMPDKLPDFEATGWGYIYSKYLLMRSWASLLQVSSTQLHLPKDIDRLVQEVYDKDFVFTRLSEGELKILETQYFEDHERGIKDQYQLALNIAVNARAESFDAYAGKPRGHDQESSGDDTLINCTRLGAQSISIIPIFAHNELLSLEQDSTNRLTLDQLTHEQIAALWEQRITVSNKKIIWALMKTDAPVYRFKNTLLKGSVAVIFNDNRLCRLTDQLALKLDQVQGLIIIDGK